MGKPNWFRIISQREYETYSYGYKFMWFHWVFLYYLCCHRQFNWNISSEIWMCVRELRCTFIKPHLHQLYSVHCTFSQHSKPYSPHNVNSQRWRAIDQKRSEKNWARDRNIKSFNWDCKWQTVFQLLACLSTVLRMLRWWQWLHHRQVGKIPHCQTTKRHDKQTERVEESLE